MNLIMMIFYFAFVVPRRRDCQNGQSSVSDRFGDGMRGNAEVLPNGNGRPIGPVARSNGFNLALGMDAASPKAR